MKQVTAKAPINIALVKYWGKRDEQEVLPNNPSVSLSLNLYHTITTLKETENKEVSFQINEHADEEIKKRALDFLRHFNHGEIPSYLSIDTINTGPTAAGLASSASGFAALAMAANEYFGCRYDFQTLASITRKGSGSAVRSLLGNCVAWYDDGHIDSIPWPFKDAVMGIVVLNPMKKTMGSTEAMKKSVQTSHLYSEWIRRSNQDFKDFIVAAKEHDFSKIGEIAESNALFMHSVCETTNPPIHYLTPQSYELIHAIQTERKKGNFQAYCTMDAGPNIKILTNKSEQEKITTFLTQANYSVLWSGIDTDGAVILP